MKNLNVIIFDAYGTLFKVNSDKTLIISLLGDKKKEFLILWRKKLLEYSWLCTLMGEWMPFNEIVRKALLFTCKQYQINTDIIPLLMEVYKKPSLFDDAVPLLKFLFEKKIQCCIMSNGEPETLKTALQTNKIDHLIKEIFSASKVQHYKVSPKVYRMATELFNTGPSNMFFVSSNSWDISGAGNFGYTTVWVNRNKETFDTLVDNPNFEVNSMKEIKKLLQVSLQ
jgi:2-haloacid dehalogenase